mgnify:CR=1 FL=1
MDRRGFTLIEILASLTLIGLAVVYLVQLFSANLRTIGTSQDYMEALTRAEAVMREVETFIGAEAGTYTGLGSDVHKSAPAVVAPAVVDTSADGGVVTDDVVGGAVTITTVVAESEPELSSLAHAPRTSKTQSGPPIRTRIRALYVRRLFDQGQQDHEKRRPARVLPPTSTHSPRRAARHRSRRRATRQASATRWHRR